MRNCDSCGFTNAEDDKPCPLCGASATQRLGGDETPTIDLAGVPARTPGGSRPPATYPAGHLYGGRFRIDAFLGRGGMGSVYRVHDLVEKRDGALKILLTSKEEDPEGAVRFQREIAILAKIQHPAVPRVFGAGANGEELFFVSELVDGRDLRTQLSLRGVWPAAEAASLGATVADALAAAHALGIIHRDVKPHNIMVDKNGSIRLLDFGVARGVGLDMKTITKTGMIVGTPEYMSPEQLDSHRIDERSDLYSLGVVLFELVTGKLPFTGETPVAVAMKHLQEKAPTPRSVRADVPAWIEKIIMRCLEKDPAKRHATAADLAADLRTPRVSSAPKQRRLPSGDSVIEDDSGATSWALVLSTTSEKGNWTPGLALHFEERYYKLREVVPPDPKGMRWLYRFDAWPEHEVFRKQVDYEAEAAAAAAAKENSLGAKLKKWIPGGR